MGREVRRVPADWQHPQDAEGYYIPLFDGKDYDRLVREWDEGEKKFRQGLYSDWNGGWILLDETVRAETYSEWAGERPNKEFYMPIWTNAEATHYMMYETTTEGTPISPAFATPEELAQWLADNNASAFGDSTASYEAWLNVARGEYAPSAVIVPHFGGLISGVESTRLQTK